MAGPTQSVDERAGGAPRLEPFQMPVPGHGPEQPEWLGPGSAEPGEAGIEVASLGRPELLVIGSDPIAALWLSGRLRNSYYVYTSTTLAAVLPRLSTAQRAIVVTDLELPDGDGVQLCTAAKTPGRVVLVLLCTSDVAAVPRALRAGCDSVLVKPFAPNLLYARLGRLTRDLDTQVSLPGATRAGTNQECAQLACPACQHSGAMSFDATSSRRAWYACLSCDHVWIAKQQE